MTVTTPLIEDIPADRRADLIVQVNRLIYS
jgi:hypothetical protein